MEKVTNRLLFTLIFVVCVMFLNTELASGATGLSPSGTEVVKTAVTDSLNKWISKAAEIAIWLLGATFTITYMWELYKLAISGQLEMVGVISTLIRLLMTVGIFYWLAENPSIIESIPNSLKEIGIYIGGVDPTPGGIIDALSECASAFNNVPLSWTAIFPCLMVAVCSIGVTLMGFYIAGQILCVQIEMALVFVGGFFTVGLAGTPIFRDYFFGYLKGLALCGVKLMLYSLIVSLMLEPIKLWAEILINTDGKGIIDMGLSILGILFVFCMIVNSVPGYAASILLGGGSQGGLGGIFQGAAAAANMARLSGRAISSVAGKISSIGGLGNRVDTMAMGAGNKSGGQSSNSVMMSRNVNPKTDNYISNADGSI